MTARRLLGLLRALPEELLSLPVVFNVRSEGVDSVNVFMVVPPGDPDGGPACVFLSHRLSLQEDDQVYVSTGPDDGRFETS